MTQDNKKTKAQLIEELAELRRRNAELEMAHPDGTTRTFSFRGEAKTDEAHEGPLVAAFGRDITERKQDGRALNESEERFRLVTESIQDVFWISTPGISEMVYVSPAYETIWRRSRESLYESPRSFLEVLHPDDLSQYLAKVENFHVNGRAYECDYRIVPAVGCQRWIHERGFSTTDNLGNVVLMTGICTDITTRKLAEEKLRESEERFRNLAQLLPEAIFETDANLHLIYANQRAFETTGYSPEDLAGGLNALELLVPKDRDRAKANFAVRVKGLIPGSTEYEALRKDGSTFPMLFHASSIIKNGEMHGVRGVFFDITERKQAETDLLRFKLGIERCDEAIFITDAEGLFLYVNPAFEQIYGFERGEVLGKTPRILKSGVLAQEVYEQFWKTLVSKDVVAGEIVNRAKDGRLITMYGTANPILDEKNNVIGFLAIQRDITAQKQAERDRLALEAQVQHTQKLESLGVLAGGIAHDFNNLLMGVLGNAEMAMIDLPPVSPARESIEGIQSAAKRAAELSNQMLAYSGKGNFVVMPICLSQVVREMGQLLSASVSKKTVLTYQLDEAIPAIEADVSQIRQVVMNLITNANEALEDETGTVSVSTGLREIDRTGTKKNLVAGKLSQGVYAYLDVSDTGVGMDNETVAKMFEPFFTTKFTGRGLGLAALFGIVRGHKGAIQVASRPGEGTTITVLFPVTDKPLPSLRNNDVAEVTSTAHGTILLVDDEPTVLDVGARMLERAGYDVKTARDGSQAIGMFEEHSRDIVCVILDLTMPEMGGEETFAELQKIRKEVPVVLSSGFSVGDVESRISMRGFAGFLQKPYKMGALMKAVRKAISK